MKSSNYPTIKKSFSVVLLAAACIFLFTSCTKKIEFLTSSVVPAARGYVTIDKDNNNNFIIHLNVDNLAEVSRLTPPKKTYIVWMTSNKSTPKNIGQIDTSSKGYSKDLKASFESTSAAKPTKIFITAEDDLNVQQPSDEIVITTGSF